MLGEINKRNVLFIAKPQDDLFSFIPPSLAAIINFNISQLVYCWSHIRRYRSAWNPISEA